MPYNLIAATNESTVVAEYTPKGQRSDSYQSEAALEAEFIRLLQAQGYEYLAIHSEKELIANLRRQLELLNGYQFSDSEWERLFKSSIAGANDGIVEKTRRIQADHVQVLRQDSGARDTRYDVTILVNGLPLVHVELKRRGVAIREAFNQIKRYQRDSFWAASGLYEYVQIFVISNGTHTKYYSNTTRISHIKEMGEARNKSKKTGNSFEFTSFWADGSNKVIANLVDFTKTFFSRHTLLSILTRYCTFKTAQMASQLPYIDKVLFVVDRKDLDYQTMKEYDHFEKGAANSNANTAVLQRQLEGPDAQLRLWEPCWLPVPGSQWATPAGCAYVGEPGPGGNEWANQALFDYDGNALPALEKLRRDAQREDIRHGE